MNAIPARRAPTLGTPTATTAGAPVAANWAVTAVSTANRQAMPQVAAAVDQLREIFGPVWAIFASEGGKELGREPPPSVIAHPPHIPRSRVNRPDGARSSPSGLPTVNLTER